MVYNKITGEMQDLSVIEEYRREGLRFFALRYLCRDLKWGNLKECKAIIDRIWLTGRYPRSYGRSRDSVPVLKW